MLAATLDLEQHAQFGCNSGSSAFPRRRVGLQRLCLHGHARSPFFGPVGLALTVRLRRGTGGRLPRDRACTRTERGGEILAPFGWSATPVGGRLTPTAESASRIHPFLSDTVQFLNCVLHLPS